MKNTTCTIITRQSPLALWQANFVRDQLLAHHPTLTVNILGKTTTGDQQQAAALNSIGGKNLFTKELQRSLLNHTADIAVHSVKDLAVTPTPGLHLGAVCQRTDPRDAFISKHFPSLAALPPGATVGTASPRRQCQLLAARPDLNIKLLRGNVGTRLNKLDAGEFDAIILAAAGLIRLNMSHRIKRYLPIKQFIPAIGQGALGIECRTNDNEILSLLMPLQDHATTLCVDAEREVNRILGGDCFTPIGAHAYIDKHILNLTALVGHLDGTSIISAKCSGAITKGIEVARAVADELLANGAQRILAH